MDSVTQSNQLENLYTLSRKAREEKNSENAEKYYSQILLDCPNDWEAYFYSAYYHASHCTVGDISATASTFANTIKSTFNLVRENVEIEKRKAIFDEIRGNVIVLGSSMYVSALNYANEFKYSSAWARVSAEVSPKIIGVLSMYENLAIELEKEGEKNFACFMYKECVERSNLRGIPVYSQTKRDSLIAKVKQYEPMYAAPAQMPSNTLSVGQIFGIIFGVASIIAGILIMLGV